MMRGIYLYIVDHYWKNVKNKNDDKINIAFMHHGVEFLKKTERRKFEQLMESHYIDIVFRDIAMILEFEHMIILVIA